VQDDYGRGPTSSLGRVGNGLWCGRHATPSRWHLRVGATLAKVPTSVRQKEEGESPGDRSWHGASRARSGLQGSASKNHHKPEKKGAECELRVFALGQRLRHFVDHVAHTAGTANGERVRRWFQDKKAGWYAVLADPQMPTTSTLLDQAHNAIERKLFAMKGFHHPRGSQQAFLTGLAHLYNFIPYQSRAQHAGHCGVEVEGGKVPTRDWFLNLQILTSGGFR
jgi:hypothetical protein